MNTTKETIDIKLKGVLNYIKEYTDSNGYPPTIREIASSQNIKSTASVSYYLKKLENDGALKLEKTKNRAIELKENVKVKSTNIPYLGIIHAGELTEAFENVQETIAIADDLFRGKNLFVLDVRGNSMINAGILNGDKAVIKRQNTAQNREIVVAMVDGEVTLKRLIFKNGQIILHPENTAFQDIIVENVQIIGVLTGIIRSY